MVGAQRVEAYSVKINDITTSYSTKKVDVYDKTVKTGSVSIDTYNPNYYGTINVTLTPSTDYELESFKVGNNDKTASVTKNQSNYTYAIRNITSNVEITAAFTAKKTVNINGTKMTSTKKYLDITNGRVTVDKYVIGKGENLTITLAPSNNCELEQLMIGNNDVTANVVNNAYTLTNITEDVAITVTFAHKKTVKVNETTTTDYYRLRVWTVDLSGSGTTTEGNGSHTYEETQMTYKFKVNVATGSIPPINYMVNGSSSNYKSSTYQSKIKTISYVKYIDQEAIDSALASWDMSQARNGSIMGWVDSEYNLYIGSNSTIYAPIDFSNAYSNMLSLESIDFTNLDTSYVTNMTQMFYNCRNLTTLDLRNFDTSLVTKMSSMFFDCGKLNPVIVKNDDERTRINTNTGLALNKIKTVDEL